MLSPIYVNRTFGGESSVTQERCDPPKRNEEQSVPEIPITPKTTQTTINVLSATHTANPEPPTRYSRTIRWSLQNPSRNRLVDKMCWWVILEAMAPQLPACPINGSRIIHTPAQWTPEPVYQAFVYDNPRYCHVKP